MKEDITTITANWLNTYSDYLNKKGHGLTNLQLYNDELPITCSNRAIKPSKPTTPTRTITAADIRAALHEALALGVMTGVNGIDTDSDATVDAIYRKHFG